MRYAVVIESAPSNFSAYVPDLPGCVATGTTIEETETATDVLSSLTLSLELLFDEARTVNEYNRKTWPHEHIADLEERIREIATGRFGQLDG